MHVVTCIYCQEKFDRDKVKCQKIGRRYAHLTCNEPRIDVDGAAYNMILQYCRELFKDKTNFLKIRTQLKDLSAQGLTYKGIYLSLKYWYEIKKQSIERAAGGIGIVPYIYKEAQSYWKSIEPTRIPKIEQEEFVLKYERKKPLIEVLTETSEG